MNLKHKVKFDESIRIMNPLFVVIFNDKLNSVCATPYSLHIFFEKNTYIYCLLR